MESSFNMLMLLAEEIAMVTGLPRSMVGGGPDQSSGVALKRLMFTLYATTRQLFTLLHTIAQEIYGTFGWDNPFEVDDEKRAAEI